MDAQPDWAASSAANDNKQAVEDEESLSFASAQGMEITSTGESSFSSQLSPSSQRTFAHRVYRLFKFITITISLLLGIAQVVSVIFLPFDGELPSSLEAPRFANMRPTSPVSL